MMADEKEGPSHQSTIEDQENTRADEIEQGNGVVLLDLRGRKGEPRGTENLRTAKDGYVGVPPTLLKIR